MKSFDVVSLFTNVDTELSLKILERRWSEIEEHTKVNKELFFEILRFCVCENNYFSFQGNFYKQKFGLGMGQTLSTILADFVLKDLFDECIAKFPKEPTFLKKYVDDVICSMNPNNIDEALKIINSYHKNIKFTLEKEDEMHSIAFLDMKVIRTNNGSLKTNWYKKSVSCDRILNYHSKHPFSMRYNVAFSHARRVLKLSNPEFHQENRKKITLTLQKNNYPTNLINRIFKKILYLEKPLNDSNELYVSAQEVSVTEKKKIYSSFNYIPKLSECLKQELEKYNENLTLAFKPPNKINSLFTNTKDKIDKNKKSNLIYKINCTDCPSVYIGETSKYLETRLKRHKYDFENKNNNKSTKTALVRHCIDTNHTPQFEKATILDYERGQKRRELLESTYINLNSHTVNFKTDTTRISPYADTIDTFARKFNQK
jgi:GIY-YIG catalytic domain